MSFLKSSATLLLASCAFWSCFVAAADFVQQGPKLVGTGAVGSAQQGTSVAASADGNTIIVGGYADNSTAGAVWIYTHVGQFWVQQGLKLVGGGAVGAAQQGYAVAISADGNTAIVGGFNDNPQVGAAWVFTRVGSVWTQQGAKLVGTGYVGNSGQGVSVALSADGNTALLGGIGDNSSRGATWVFVRSGSLWTQQGPKLVASDAAVTAGQGSAVALSADGNTAIVGGQYDTAQSGAAWIYTRSGGTWAQQGPKLVGTGAAFGAYQGRSVAISADGNTALVGGPIDNAGGVFTGATWVYTRSGGVWNQQGPKLVGIGSVGDSRQGTSVSLSADGNKALVGGAFDASSTGAAWVFTRSGTNWSQSGAKIVGSGGVVAEQGYAVALSADGYTAAVGGPLDNGNVGAVWVYTAAAPLATPVAVPATHPMPLLMLCSALLMLGLWLLRRRTVPTSCAEFDRKRRNR